MLIPETAIGRMLTPDEAEKVIRRIARGMKRPAPSVKRRAALAESGHKESPAEQWHPAGLQTGSLGLGVQGRFPSEDSICAPFGGSVPVQDIPRANARLCAGAPSTPPVLPRQALPLWPFLPIGPGISTDRAAAGADHARAEGRHIGVIRPRIDTEHAAMVALPTADR